MIQEIVCNYFNLDQAVIQTRSRKREIVQARQITMYLAKKYTDCSFFPYWEDCRKERSCHSIACLQNNQGPDGNKQVFPFVC